VTFSKTFPMATTWGKISSSRSNSHSFICPMTSPYVVGVAQLPFVLLSVGEISGLAQSCCDRNSCYNNWFFSSNSSCIRTLSCSIFWLKSSINCCYILETISSLVSATKEEEDEFRGAAPKYCQIPTPFPAARTRSGCSSRLIPSCRISWWPWGTKLP